MKRRPFAALLILVPLACSSRSKEGPGTGETDPYPDRSSFCSAWAQAACGSTVVSNCGAASADACVASQHSFCEGLVPALGYTSANAQPCLDAVGAAYADGKLTAEERATVLALGTPCDKLSTGNAGTGEACDQNGDCNTAGGAECVIAPGHVSGTCQEPIHASGGQSCSSPASICDADFYCDAKKHCIARGAEGDACSKTEPCDHTTKCTGATGSETCTAKAASGTCSTDDDCLSGICQKAEGASTGKCVDEIILSVLDPICSDLS